MSGQGGDSGSLPGPAAAKGDHHDHAGRSFHGGCGTTVLRTGCSQSASARARHWISMPVLGSLRNQQFMASRIRFYAFTPPPPDADSGGRRTDWLGNGCLRIGQFEAIAPFIGDVVHDERPAHAGKWPPLEGVPGIGGRDEGQRMVALEWRSREKAPVLV